MSEVSSSSRRGNVRRTVRLAAYVGVAGAAALAAAGCSSSANPNAAATSHTAARSAGASTRTGRTPASPTTRATVGSTPTPEATGPLSQEVPAVFTTYSGEPGSSAFLRGVNVLGKLIKAEVGLATSNVATVVQSPNGKPGEGYEAYNGPLREEGVVTPTKSYEGTVGGGLYVHLQDDFVPLPEVGGNGQDPLAAPDSIAMVIGGTGNPSKLVVNYGTGPGVTIEENAATLPRAFDEAVEAIAMTIDDAAPARVQIINPVERVSVAGLLAAA